MTIDPFAEVRDGNSTVARLRHKGSVRRCRPPRQRGAAKGISEGDLALLLRVDGKKAQSCARALAESG